MRRLPLVPTLLVAAAALTMAALGVWQLERAQWKAGLLRSYAAAAGRAPVAFPFTGEAEQAFFRRSTAQCARVVGWDAIAGSDALGKTGIAHVARCADPAGRPFKAVLGVSEDPAPPAWSGGVVTGIIAPDRGRSARLVSEAPVGDLRAHAAPDVRQIPNNHLAYAVQWFFFAATALVIYALALRRRRRAP